MVKTLRPYSREAAGETAEVREPADARKVQLTAPTGGAALMPILLVEDSAPNRLVATAILTKAGYQVETAENGLQAVSAVTQKRYGLVLMDIAMPEMDGLAATQSIRALGGERGDVPIVAMTAGAFNEDKQRCLDAGMDDYLSKPVVRADLLRVVDRWLRSADGPGTHRAPASAATTISLLDEAVLRELEQDVTGDLLPGLVASFVAEVRRLVPGIEGAAETGDLASVRHHAHALKGSAGTFGASALQSESSALERAAGEGRLELVRAHLPPFMAIARDTLTHMEERFGITADNQGKLALE